MSHSSPEAAQLVKNLMEQPGNTICADCQKNSTKWASTTLGIFICIECSGIHRNLGTHISFVRSVTLDSWTPEQARLMKRVGNIRANQYWEAKLPPEFVRPSSGDRAGMELFIRQKYVNRLWAADGDPPQFATSRIGLSSKSTVRPTIDMYTGFFQQQQQQQQPQPAFAKKVMQVSRSNDNLEIARKPAQKSQSMPLSDFMNFMNQNKNDDAEVNDKEPQIQPQQVSAPAIIETKNLQQQTQKQQKPIPKPKPVQQQQVQYPTTGSTAHDIMMAAQNDPQTRKMFGKKPKGAARFMKRASNDAVFDQMLQMSESNNRPESAPVIQDHQQQFNMFTKSPLQ